MNSFYAAWYLIYTKPNHERKVHSYLIEREIKSLLPTRKAIKVWRDRKKYVEQPLFPSYVFVYLRDMQNYYEGIEAEGSLYYVKTGKEMARVDEAVVNNIMLVTQRAKELEVSASRFCPGRKFVISKGALTGLSCELVEFNNFKKVLVRVDFLQRNLLLALPDEYLIEL
jgi:transcriptional antiterminator RfaH